MGKKKRQKQSSIARYGTESEMNPALAKQTIEMLGKVCSASAIECFDREDDKVRRVVVKINPQVYGQFLVLTIMQSDVRYEGVVNQAKR